MRQGAISPPKMKSVMGEEKLRFGSLSDAIGAYHARTAGKILLISDGEGLSALAPHSLSPRSLFVVLETGEALPLFSMPDSVGGIIAAGGGDVMRAARFFAMLHRITPLLLPSDSAMDGVLGDSGQVKIEGEERTLPLASGEIVCDLARMQPSLPRAYARLLLMRLAAFEKKALSRFQMAEYPAAFEEAICTFEGAEDAESIVRANAKVRLLEAQGLPHGEGETLASMLPLGGELAAYRALLSLYHAFFNCGVPRKYVIPPYHVRAERANVSYGSLHIPTPEELKDRARLLEKMRKPCLEELTFLMRQEQMHLRNIRALGGEAGNPATLPQLKFLPEHCPGGLSCLIRDFGLMEF